MDQCCGLTGSMKQEDLLRVDFPADQCIPASTAVKVMQSLFIYESAYLDGASLMESIQQCIFCWEGSWAALEARAAAASNGGAVERALLAYAQSVVLSVSYQFKAVMAADIYEGAVLCFY